MESDISIAGGVKLKPIDEIASKLGLSDKDIMHYGRYKAKVSVKILGKLNDNPDGKLVLVTSMTPTRAGEGKSTTTIGLTQALNKIGRKATLCIREPSLGPCMGVKGGATGGGYSQVLPMEDINLHFTGDIPAVSAAHNMLSAVLDNHIYHGNELAINPNMVLWRRVVDMNDRALRRIFIGIGDTTAIAREDGFDISASSEVMAILCLAESYHDLKERLGRIIVAYTIFGKPITVKQLKVEGAMAALLKHAFNPNLVQTLEGVPAFIHGGPFANIAHGCSSVVSAKIALKLADIVVTEAGFGSDLGAEKFFNIFCRSSGLKPSAIVLVATVRALKHHGGVTEYDKPDVKAVERGWPNLEKHIENVGKYGVPFVVALNRFKSDSEDEVGFVLEKCGELGVPVALSDVHTRGGDGGIELAEKVVGALESEGSFKFLYGDDSTVKEKIGRICVEMYGADGVDYTESAEHDIKHLEELGFRNFPICMSKTQKSFSDDGSLLGRPKGFKITVKKVTASAGAGFLVAMAGKIIAMPGLPKKPAAEAIDIDDEGKVSGLF
ncbi:MAG: formate--tetrahydrofolate ligase [Candidatus Altiarchaeota archaeon]